ncbi:hypothetical protein Bca4012_020266 [Brassica carinata]
MTSTFHSTRGSVDWISRESGYRKKSRPFKSNSHVVMKNQHRPTGRSPHRSTGLHKKRSIFHLGHRLIPRLHQTKIG